MYLGLFLLQFVIFLERSKHDKKGGNPGGVIAPSNMGVPPTPIHSATTGGLSACLWLHASPFAIGDTCLIHIP